MKKILLIAGGSDLAGSEIDGTEDSTYNRQHSFSNLLASKLGRVPINIALAGAANPGIARSVIEWFASEYDSSSMDVTALVGWTESSRMEVPVDRPTWYNQTNASADWYSSTSTYYHRINFGWTGGDAAERNMISEYHRFMVDNLVYLEILSVNTVLMLQYFFRLNRIKYTMCNTMYMFTDNIYLKPYLKLVDQSCYLHMLDPDQTFYKKFKDAGYVNPLAKYWHHSEIPHRLYADELFNFIK